ncbi:MAG: hypothetical protein U0R70_16365 [Solirubrobacteraceae bacterium]
MLLGGIDQSGVLIQADEHPSHPGLLRDYELVDLPGLEGVKKPTKALHGLPR